jgi:hypothetical protein
MSQDDPHRIPTRTSTAIFLAKACVLQLRRAAQDQLNFIKRHPQGMDRRFSVQLARSSTTLWTDPAPSEAWYQRGKIQNLRVAAARLDRCIIPAGEVFSFWRQVGRASGHRGYVRGRMLQEGCMIPAVGGGLCQLSNALYQVALDAGCEIIERHPHSRIVPGSATAAGRDATVAWNYIDLRFRVSRPIQLSVQLTPASLDVSLLGEVGGEKSASIQLGSTVRIPVAAVNALPILNDHACESCGQVACFRHDHDTFHLKSNAAKAFLLDAAWPEFARYVDSNHTNADRLALPIDGGRWKLPQYAWPTRGFASVDAATLTTLRRAAQSRRLAAQGALRQKALLEGARALASQLAKTLDPDVDEVCVSQSLLPFLWRAGVLGGRRVHVLCSQLPVRALEAELDQAASVHSESKTLRDFRAEAWLDDAEDEALGYAEKIITPHRQVASLFEAKAVLLGWSTPAPGSWSARLQPNETQTILFPCATIGRKGAYELRDAVRGMNVRILLGGRVLESEDFWRGYQVEFAKTTSFEEVDLVVQPSIVESQPRALLRALAAGIPVVTTINSGLHADSPARFVAALDSAGLRTAIESQLGKRQL